MNSFWESITDGIDEKFINDTVDFHVRKMPRENILVPVETEVFTPTSKRMLVVKTALKIVAAIGVVIGISVLLKINNVPVFETLFSSGSGSEITDVPYEESGFEMPEPFYYHENSGSDENSLFYLPCNRILDNIPGDLLGTRPSDKINEWINSFDARKNPPESIEEYPNVYSFIIEFNISDNELKEAFSYYLNSTNEQLKISDEEFATILTRDIRLITEKFASEYSVVKGDKVYCPNWIYKHTSDDYKNAGITPQDIIERAPLYCDFTFTQEAASAFEKKLSGFTGTAVNIDFIPRESKDSQSIYDISDETDVIVTEYDEGVEVEEGEECIEIEADDDAVYNEAGVTVTDETAIVPDITVDSESSYASSISLAAPPYNYLTDYDLKDNPRRKLFTGYFSYC